MKNIINGLAAISLLNLVACNDAAEKKVEGPDSADVKKAYAISSEDFGTIGNETITQYSIANPNGVVVKIINYGATVTSVMVPDKSGKMGDVVLGFDSLSGYLQTGNPYMGCIVGRYANRIANAKFALDGQTYTLAANNNGNSLHGGAKGFDKVVWTAKPQPGDSSILLTYTSKDGEEGYPGTLQVEVTYTLTPNNELKIDYFARTDKATPVNLTNHSYFNLSAGADSTILGHEIMIKSDLVTAVNDKLIPTGAFTEVKGGPMDFNAAKQIGKDIAQVPGGYDHNWVLRRNDVGPEMIASLYHPGSGRYMEVYTTEPGIQFYTGNFLDGSLTGKGGKKYVRNAGLCLETQHFPDSPNQKDFPTTVLKPNEAYKQTTWYRFSVK
jgi:aldose 1-epimerase